MRRIIGLLLLLAALVGVAYLAMRGRQIEPAAEDGTPPLPR